MWSAHGELTVKHNAEVLDSGWKLDSSVGKGQSSGRYFVQLLTCTQPDDLRLLFVQLQVIVGHPVDEEGRVVSIHKVAEVFAADLNLGLVFHVPQDPIDGDTDEGWCQDTALPYAWRRQ